MHKRRKKEISFTKPPPLSPCRINTKSKYQSFTASQSFTSSWNLFEALYKKIQEKHRKWGLSILQRKFDILFRFPRLQPASSLVSPALPGADEQQYTPWRQIATIARAVMRDYLNARHRAQSHPLRNRLYLATRSCEDRGDPSHAVLGVGYEVYYDHTTHKALSSQSC